MCRALARVAIGVVGVDEERDYVGGAYLIYLVLRYIWADRPSAVMTMVIVAAVTLVLGYLIGNIVEVHRFLTSGPRDGIDRLATEIFGWLR